MNGDSECCNIMFSIKSLSVYNHWYMLDNHLPLESLRGVDIYGFLVKNHFNSLRTIVPV